MQQSILFVTLMVSISTSLLAVQAGGSSSMPMTVEEITTYTKKENLNGQEFVYSQQVINGKATKGWTIDGRPVTYDEYVEAYAQAMADLHRAQVRADQERRERELVAQENLARAGNKRLLMLTLTDVEESLHALRDYRLEPYFIFSHDTYPSRSVFDKIVQCLVPEAKRLLESDTVVENADYEQMVAQLEGAPEKLTKLLQATADNAIKHCNDTKVLKDLLALTT